MYFGAIAHFERRLIAECTKDGINTARLKSKIPGRPTLDKEKLNSALKSRQFRIRKLAVQ